jgi:Protein of unknown function (DUF1579)
LRRRNCALFQTQRAALNPAQWVYDGEFYATGRILTLNSDGPTLDGDGKMTKYKDIIEFKSDDHRVVTARMLAPDGTWQQLMSVDYRRRNK